MLRVQFYSIKTTMPVKFKVVYGWLAGKTPETSLELAMKAAEITIMDVLTVNPKIQSLAD